MNFLIQTGGICTTPQHNWTDIIRRYDLVMEHINIKAYGKVNLGLDVTGIREDGYHLVKMVMQTVDVWDDISLTRKNASADSKEAKITLSCDLPGVPEDERNLAFRAADIVRSRYHINDGVHIDIRKNIPMAAGMAGGSADAAAVIHGMNELFALGMDREDMDRTALMIGADVPFCLRHGTYLAEGIGEKLTKLPDLMHCHMVIIKPQISVSTPWAYKALDQMQRDGNRIIHPDIDLLMESIEKGDLRSMTQAMGNILEAPVIGKYTEIGIIKRKLMENGAMTALMSGSGSAVFGIFEDPKSADQAFRHFEGEQYGKFKVEF